MAALLLSNFAAAILEVRGHRVQNDLIAPKGLDFDYNILRARHRHRTPKFGEMPAFYVKVVKGKKYCISLTIELYMAVKLGLRGH